MAETIKAKLRVKEIYLAGAITAAGGYKSASWTRQPLTLQDDQLILSEAEPEENAINVHEMDTPIDVEFTGGAKVFSGSFVEVTLEQAKALLGHVESEGFDLAIPAGKYILNNAVKIVDTKDKVTLLPNARGYVLISEDFSAKTGRAKFPFKFTALAASPEWPVDVAFPTAEVTPGI